jgi:alpha-galactosidase
MELKRLKQIGWLIVVAGVLCSLFLWGQRMQSEANYKNVQMVVNYSDIVAMANANDLTEEEFAKALQERGVSAVLYKEWSLGSLNANGQVAIEVGNNIEHASYVEKVSKEVPVSAANAYVALLDKNIAVQVKDHVLEKVPGADYYPGQVDVITIPIMVPNGDSEVVTALNKIKEIGAELFVIDDGWFTNRIDDRRALGDWQACKDRFPNGLGVISDKAHEAGLLFGLWVEPEMINEDSELYSLHPDWVLQYETRPMSKMRSQMVLDITKPEVYEFCKNMLDRVITEYKLDYLKWDMNRYIAETGKDSDFFVKYTQALWGLYKHIRYTYPSLLIENCAHGGARSDYGMMPYSDRINRSDNSDPVDVLKLHEGFSTYILPRYAGGAGNVATSPNGQNGRVTPLKFRAHLGMTGSMSVGFDLLTAKKEDIEGIKEYIKYYKTIRPMLHSSYLYRISSALDNGIAIWQYTARDRSKAVVFIFAHGVRWGEGMESIKLIGLKPNSRYEINGKTYSGDTLMKYGYYIRKPSGDYYSEIIEVTEIN